MACSSCGTGGCGTKKDGKVGGCKNNGTCGTGGCNKMNVFDWLSNMELPTQQRFDIVEVRFKNGRKEFFKNSNDLELTTGDMLVIDAGGGHHIGELTLQGELVRLQMLKKKVKNDNQIKIVYRIASEKDMERYHEARNREMSTLFRTRQIIDELKIEMKLSDIEFQADNSKATFFYSADDRVDFRELIKLLAAEFKIRVEMRQISLRQEAGRVGGIGACGRELCCSTWLTDFKSVSTAAARYQNLSLNPVKLSGQCGRLKCCLNYELETYLDALVDIPKVEKPLLTEGGAAHLQKTDIFKKILWFSYDTESTWYPISAAKVKQILELNEKGITAPTLTAEEPQNENPNAKPKSESEKRNEEKEQQRQKIAKNMANRARGGSGTSNQPPRNPNSKPHAKSENSANNNKPKKEDTKKK
jgi:cell fate regulator YaaT (PSP1 superfamily)